MTRFSCFLATAMAAATLATAACRGGAGSQATLPSDSSPAAATSGTARAATAAPPTATLPDGTSISLELAVTQEEISRGLMFRPSLAANRGMLFLFAEERVPSFWMKDTLIPLDIVFLDGAGVIVDMATDAQPCKAEPCPQYVSKKPAAAVLELAAGSAARHALAVGDGLRFERVPQYPRG